MRNHLKIIIQIFLFWDFIAIFQSPLNVSNGQIIIETNNESMEVIWNSTVEEQQYSEFPETLIESKDGGFVVGGKAISPSGEDGFSISKVNKNGESLWESYIPYNGIIEEVCRNCLIETSDKGYMLARYSWKWLAWKAAFYLIKFDSQGSILWNRTIWE